MVMLRKSIWQDKNNEKQISAFMINLILPFLSTGIHSSELMSFKKVCRIFHGCARLYLDYLTEKFSAVEKDNITIVSVIKDNDTKIKLIEDKKLNALKLLQLKHDRERAEIEKQYSAEIDEKKSEHEKIIQETKTDLSKAKEKLVIFLQQNINLLTEFQDLLSEELAGMSWWAFRIEYVDSGEAQNLLQVIDYHMFPFFMIMVYIMAIEALIFVFIGIIALSPSAAVLGPVALAIISTFFATPFIALCTMSVPTVIGLCSYLMGLTKFDMRSQKERFDDRKLSSFDAGINNKFNDIKEQNNPNNFLILDGFSSNPFSSMSNNTRLHTISNAITARLTLFQSTQTAIKNPITEEPLSAEMALKPLRLE